MAENTFLWNISGWLPLPDILLKRYSENFWKILKKAPLKKSCFNNDWDSRPETYYNVVVLKQVTYVAYMLKIILLTGTPHGYEFLENFKSVPEIYDFFLLLKNNESFSNKQNCFLRGWSSWMFFTRAKMERFVKIVNGF